MEDLRNHLFETLEALKDQDKPMDVDRAQAICKVSHQLIESAKVEVKYLETTGQETPGQFFSKKKQPQLAAANGKAC